MGKCVESALREAQQVQLTSCHKRSDCAKHVKRVCLLCSLCSCHLQAERLSADICEQQCDAAGDGAVSAPGCHVSLAKSTCGERQADLQLRCLCSYFLLSVVYKHSFWSSSCYALFQSAWYVFLPPKSTLHASVRSAFVILPLFHCLHVTLCCQLN